MLLKNDTSVRTGTSNFLPVQKNPALRRHEEAGDHRKERRFSAAGRTQRNDALAGSDRQIQLRQSQGWGTPLFIMNAEIIDFEYATLLTQKGRAANERGLSILVVYFAAFTYSSVTNLA
jgi:hypothetical protein